MDINVIIPVTKLESCSEPELSSYATKNTIVCMKHQIRQLYVRCALRLFHFNFLSNLLDHKIWSFIQKSCDVSYTS